MISGLTMFTVFLFFERKKICLRVGIKNDMNDDRRQMAVVWSVDNNFFLLQIT